jgi:hypothetical protein
LLTQNGHFFLFPIFLRFSKKVLDGGEDGFLELVEGRSFLPAAEPLCGLMNFFLNFIFLYPWQTLIFMGLVMSSYVVVHSEIRTRSL